MKVSDQVGTLSEGKYADIMAARGDVSRHVDLLTGSRLLLVIAVAPSGLDYLGGLTQGSQSLALGLTLTTATQLVEVYVEGRSE
jgi:hypothetical protein